MNCNQDKIELSSNKNHWKVCMMIDIEDIMIVDSQSYRSLVIYSIDRWSDNSWQYRQHIYCFDKYHRKEFILCISYFTV